MFPRYKFEKSLSRMIFEHHKEGDKFGAIQVNNKFYIL